MFEYSGSAYTTHEATSNVTAAALLTSDKPAGFFAALHEDLDWHNLGLSLPAKYENMPLLDDILMKRDAKPRKLADITYKRPSLQLYINPEIDTKELSFDTNKYDPDHIAIVNRIAVGRPALATCPVQTLLIWTNSHVELQDMSDYFNLTDIESVRNHRELKRLVEREGESKEMEWVEFGGEQGPLMWVKFVAFDKLQFEQVLGRRRAVRQVQVLLISTEDRREDYQTRDAGIDINYVVCTGWSLARSTE